MSRPAHTLVLLHSPLTDAGAWGLLPGLVAEAGRPVLVVDVRDDDRPPYAARYVARAALQIREQVDDRPVVLVGQGEAGPLLPAVGFARHALGAPVRGYVLLDADLPRSARAVDRLGLLAVEDAGRARRLRRHLEAGGRSADPRPRGLDFFTEPLPLPEDWPDAPVGYLQLSERHARSAATARQRGWTTRHSALGHGAAREAPAQLRDELVALLEAL